MKLIGNIHLIKNKRDSANEGIEIHLDRVEYITQMKDGRYYQPFSFVKELETPLVITGDCLARSLTKPSEEGEYEFQVYEKDGDTFELNTDKQLSLTVIYDYEADLNILTSVHYAITVSNKEFKELKGDWHKVQVAKRGKGRKNKR